MDLSTERSFPVDELERRTRLNAADDAMLRSVIRVLRLAASKGVTSDELERLQRTLAAHQRAKDRLSN